MGNDEKAADRVATKDRDDLPADSPARRRYTLDELLVGAECLPELYAGLEGALDGPPVGREIG